MITRFIGFTIIFGVLLTCLPLTSSAQQSTDIRGQVVSYNPYSRNFAPAASVKVDLYKRNSRTQKWEMIQSKYTDRSGMYYMYRIQPGNYFLQVNRANHPVTVRPMSRSG